MGNIDDQHRNPNMNNNGQITRQPGESDEREEALAAGGIDLLIVPGLAFTRLVTHIVTAMSSHLPGNKIAFNQFVQNTITGVLSLLYVYLVLIMAL